MERRLLACYDFDGTIIDTEANVRGGLRYSCLECSYPYPGDEKVSGIIANPLKKLAELLISDHPEPFESLWPNFQSAYLRFQTENFHLINLFPQTLEALERLRQKDIPLAIVTSRGETSTEELLNHFRIADYFQLIVGSTLVTDHKPHPAGVKLALSHFQIPPELAYLVGDTAFDIQAGKAAGVRTIGLSCGFEKARIAEAKPDYLGEHIGHSADFILSGY